MPIGCADLDATVVIRGAYRRLAEADDPGIFITLIPEAEALERLRGLGGFEPTRKPLWGVPFAVKDNMDVAGLVTTAGCPDYAYLAEGTAFAVRRLLNVGAVLIAKTNLDQFATGLVGVRTPLSGAAQRDRPPMYQGDRVPVRQSPWPAGSLPSHSERTPPVRAVFRRGSITWD